MYKTFFFVDITTSPPGGVYFTALSAKGLDKDEKDKEGKYIRRERLPEMQAGAFMWEITFREKTSIRNLKMVFFPLLFQKRRRQ